MKFTSIFKKKTNEAVNSICGEQAPKAWFFQQVAAGSVDNVTSYIDKNPEALYWKIDGCSALHMALDKRHEELACCLIEKGISTAEKDYCGITPLRRALDAQLTEVIMSLLKHGADPNTTDSFGETALLSFCKRPRMQEEYILLLLNAGADFNRVDKAGISAREYITRAGFTAAQALIEEKTALREEALRKALCAAKARVAKSCTKGLSHPITTRGPLQLVSKKQSTTGL